MDYYFTTGGFVMPTEPTRFSPLGLSRAVSHSYYADRIGFNNVEIGERTTTNYYSRDKPLGPIPSEKKELPLTLEQYKEAPVAALAAHLEKPGWRYSRPSFTRGDIKITSPRVKDYFKPPEAKLRERNTFL